MKISRYTVLHVYMYFSVSFSGVKEASGRCTAWSQGSHQLYLQHATEAMYPESANRHEA